MNVITKCSHVYSLSLLALALLLVSTNMHHVHSQSGPVCVIDAKTGKHRCTVHTEGGEDYDGEWEKFAPEGFGTYENDGLEYVGEFKNGRFHGKGKVTCVHPEHREFEGTFVDGRMEEGRVTSVPGSRSHILLQDYPMCRQ